MFSIAHSFGKIHIIYWMTLEYMNTYTEGALKWLAHQISNIFLDVYCH